MSLECTSPQSCDLCPYTSALQVHVVAHKLKAHVADEQRQCDKCEFSCARLVDMSAHQRVQHSS
jgi:hypothetical protein